MTNKVVIDALKKIKTYCAADLLDKLDYAIDIIEIGRASCRERRCALKKDGK